MSADHRATLTSSPARPARVVEALQPEQDAIPGEAVATVEQRQDAVQIEVVAPTVGSLRAGVAGWMSLLDVATAAADRP